MSLALWEHKTTSEDISQGSSYWKRVISIDCQIDLYINGLRAIGIDCRGVVYDALRKPAHRPSSKGETPEHYEKRVLSAISANPDRYYQRTDLVRLTAERVESRFDVWQTAHQIKESRRLNVWPRNSDACMQWGRACDYLPVCSGEAEITDVFLYRKGDRVHEELAPIVDMYKCTGCGKVVPVAETYESEDSSAARPVRGHSGCWRRVELIPRDPREVLTQSAIRCFRSCARKYQLRYVTGMKTLKKPEPLRAGSSIHAALNEWMRTGGDLQAALHKLDADDLYANARERALVTGYHCRWDRPPKIVAVEREWTSDLVNPETNAASRTYRLAGKADVLVELDDEQAAAQKEPSMVPALEASVHDGGAVCVCTHARIDHGLHDGPCQKCECVKFSRELSREGKEETYG